MKKLATSIGITTILLAGGAITSVSAHEDHSSTSYSSDNSQCEVALNYDITIEPKQLTISEGGQEVYRIEMGKLYVQGEKVPLNARQKKLITQYSDEVSNQIPEVIALIHDAVGMASTAASIALTPLLGDDAGDRLELMMEGLKQRIEQFAYQNGDKFYLGSIQSSLKDMFGEEFEQEIEQLVKSSIGSMMINLGSEMLAGGDSFEQKMEAFAQKMENVSQNIELQVEAQAQSIEVRADKMCDNLQGLIALEQKLRIVIPELKKYPLLDELK